MLITQQDVRDVIAAVRERRELAGHPFPHDILRDMPAEKVTAIMEMLADADILEYGVSLRTGWIQDYATGIEQRIEEFIARWPVGDDPAPRSSG